MPPDVELVREWVTLANDDLYCARLILSDSSPRLRAACFHCQQAVEKALKAVLEWHGQCPAKTHSLDTLVDHCERIDPALGALRSECTWLSDFAVGVRYPGFEPEPTAERTREALQTAESTCSALWIRLPAATLNREGREEETK